MSLKRGDARQRENAAGESFILYPYVSIAELLRLAFIAVVFF